MQVRIFSPRRKPTQLEVNPAETFGAIRARLGKEFGIAELSGVAGGRGLILHHGETVEDDEPVSSRLHGTEEVLFFMEIADPPKHVPRARMNQGLFGVGGIPGGRGAGRGMPAGNSGAANLAASLMQRLQQAGAAGRPQAQAAAAQRPPLTQQQQQQQQNAMAAQELVKQLMEMGFSKLKATAALRNSSFDLIDALQWLEEHADDPDSMFEGNGGGSVGAGAGGGGGAGGAAPASSAPAPAAQQAPSPMVIQMAPLFAPVLRAIALVANKNMRPHQVLDQVRLPAMEGDGWKGLHATVRRIWAGERNATALKGGLDANTSFFVDKVLELVAVGADALERQADDDTWAAMPKDPEFDAVVQQLRPMLQRMAKFAVARTRDAFGQGSGMLDEKEEGELTVFIDKMEAAQYQLKTGWEMVCAGVRETGDLLECVSPLANGKPDDKSARLLRTLVQLIVETEVE